MGGAYGHGSSTILGAEQGLAARDATRGLLVNMVRSSGGREVQTTTFWCWAIPGSTGGARGGAERPTATAGARSGPRAVRSLLRPLDGVGLEGEREGDVRTVLRGVL